MAIAVTPTRLEGVVIIDPRVFPDDRGYFMESWNEREYREAGITGRFVQDSHSRSTFGVLRGLHYQDMRAPMSKLVRCTVGRIFDVVVDLRVGSPTFGSWVAEELSAENKRQIHVPIGFAHGFQALSDAAEVQYKQTAFYVPAATFTLAWDDPDLGVSWPLPRPILSERDERGITLKEYAERPAFRYGAVDAPGRRT